MEDTGVFNVVKKFKWVFICITILIAIILLIFVIGKSSNENRLENYLQKHEYKNKNGVFYKTVTESGDMNSTINYIFSIKANKFTKNIKNIYETIILKYDGTNDVEISYYSESFSPNYYAISQSATYNIKTKTFDCKILKAKGDYKLMCPRIKEEAIVFSGETNNIIKKAKINNLFTTKKSKKI